MLRFDPRRGGSAVLVSVALCLAAGCGGYVYAEPAPAVAVVAQPVAVAEPVADAPEGGDDVVYVEQPPVVDIETYPMVVYGGVNVYYVGGVWYQRGPRGWAYYRQEPPELGRQREARAARDHDPRWADRGRLSQPDDHRGVINAQAAEHRDAPPPSRAPLEPAHLDSRRSPTAPPPVAEVHEEREPGRTPAPAPIRKPPAKRRGSSAPQR